MMSLKDLKGASLYKMGVGRNLNFAKDGTCRLATPHQYRYPKCPFPLSTKYKGGDVSTCDTVGGREVGTKGTAVGM